MMIRKIVLVHTGITGGFGGAERLLFEEFRYFTSKGIKVKIMVPYLDVEPLRNYKYCDEVVNNIEVIKGKNPLQRIFLLRRRILEINPDIVIGVLPIDIFLATLFTRIPYILHIHGSTFWFPPDTVKYALIHRRVFHEIRNTLRGHKEFIPLKPSYHLKSRLLLEFRAILDYLAVRRAKKIIVLTERVKWEVKKLYGRDAVVARGCLDPSIFNYGQREDIRERLNLPNEVKIILSVSRMDPRKRLDLLIKAFAKVVEEIRDVVLVIVGGGGREYEMRLKNLAKNLNCLEKVIFTGFLSDDRLWDYYAACDVFACPAWVTSPITCYEALAFNKKVVWTSEASEPEEILREEHVFLAEPTVDDFAKALKKALSTRVERKINLRGYTWENYFDTVFKVCLDVLRDRVQK